MGRKEPQFWRPKVARISSYFLSDRASATRQSQVALNRFKMIEMLRLLVLRPRLAVGLAFIGAIANV